MTETATTSAKPPGQPPSLKNSLQQLNLMRHTLNSIFVERGALIDGCLAALLAGEHVLLIGPPGTAKSALVRALAASVSASYWELLFTKFTTPEEVFGPVSLKGLEEDRYERITTGRLPEAEVAFLDEVFKASSAILNTLLAAMNERVYDNGSGRGPKPIPLLCLFGASNELPDAGDLEALFDRFALRYEVGYVRQRAHQLALLTARDPKVTEAVLTVPQLERLRTEVAGVTLNDATLESLLNIKEACEAQGIVASDRRWKRLLRIVQAHAFMDGAKETEPEDLTVIVDALWRDPKDRGKISTLVGQVADPAATEVLAILDAATETQAKLSKLHGKDRMEYLKAATEALRELEAQHAKLTQLASSGGRRAKGAAKRAIQQIEQFDAEVNQHISSGLGLKKRLGGGT